jgi:hypothetical protein
VSNSPEKQLEEFLASKPDWMRRMFQTGSNALTESELLEWCRNHEEVTGLTDEYEQILQHIPAKWREYRKRLQRENHSFIDKLLVPKGKAGRKRNEQLAERIWQLDADGRSNREIQKALNDSGENLSIEAVESYLKNRRRPRSI